MVAKFAYVARPSVEPENIRTSMLSLNTHVKSSGEFVNKGT
jgi:hypothetical protein